MQLGERTIIVSDFVEARSKEIFQLKRLLDKQSTDSNKLPHQLLAQHMRRRAMSHNRYRIPSRIRNRLNMDMLDNIEKGQKAVWCRKQLRRPQLLLSSYAKRSRKFIWLETHLWHAQRMKMAQYFGHKVALNPIDKGQRPCFRYAQNQCVIYDKSYYTFHLIEGTDIHELQIWLQNHVESQYVSDVFSERVVAGQQSCQFELFDDISSNIRIHLGIATALFKKRQTSDEGFQILLMIHPGSDYKIKEIFQKFSSQSMFYKQCEKQFYSLFELNGPESLKQITLMLQNLNTNLFNDEEFKNINPLTSDLLDCFSTISDAVFYPDNLILPLNFKAQISQKLVTPPFNFQQQTAKSVDYQSIERINQNLIQLQQLQHKNDLQAEYPKAFKLWHSIQASKDENIRELVLKSAYKITTRGQYTHQQKGQFDKNQQKAFMQYQKENSSQQKASSKDIQSSSQKIARPSDKPKLADIIEQTQEQLENSIIPEVNDNNIIHILKPKTQQILQVSLKPQENQEFLIDLMIIINNKSRVNKKKLQRVSIIVGEGQGNRIWRIFSYLACKAIGLQEYKLLHRERKIPFFPDDYPFSSAYEIIQQEEINRNISLYNKKPKAKRVNYFQTNSCSPYGPDWNKLFFSLGLNQKIDAVWEDLVRVKVDMINRGIPRTNAYICLPEPSDIQKLENYFKLNQNNEIHSLQTFHVYVQPVKQFKQIKSEQGEIQTIKKTHNQKNELENELENQQDPMSRKLIGTENNKK